MPCNHGYKKLLRGVCPAACSCTWSVHPEVKRLYSAEFKQEDLHSRVDGVINTLKKHLFQPKEFPYWPKYETSCFFLKNNVKKQGHFIIGVLLWTHAVIVVKVHYKSVTGEDSAFCKASDMWLQSITAEAQWLEIAVSNIENVVLIQYQVNIGPVLQISILILILFI